MPSSYWNDSLSPVRSSANVIRTPLVEERQLLQALLERVVDELGVREDLRVGLEGGLGAALGGRADAADFGLGDAAFVFLLIDVAVAADFDFAPFGEEIDDRDADAVQAAGGLVGAFFELAAELRTVITPSSVETSRPTSSESWAWRSTGMPRPSSSTVTRAVDVDR